MKKLIMVFTCVGLLIGCSKSGSEFIGNWKKNEVNISIKKSENLFIIRDDEQNQMLKTISGAMINAACGAGAVLKNNQLVCTANVSFGYDKEHDQLMSPMGKFSRVK
jgi:hypothetical protein